MQLMARFQRITQTSVLYQNCREAADCAWTAVSNTLVISQIPQHVHLLILVPASLIDLKQTLTMKVFNFQINCIQFDKYLLRYAQIFIYFCKKHYKIKIK
jgi:hypothetical protein